MKAMQFVVPSLVGLALAISASAVFAASWDTCNGDPVKWRGTLSIHRNSCSIPDTGDVNSSYWNGVGQWDDLTNEVDQFLVRPTNDCSYDTDDGMNEIALVNRANIDGNNGVTFITKGACFIGSNDIDQADLVVANDMNFTNRVGNFLGTSGRSTFVHEFGHFFGFNHEQAHGVMRTSPPHLLTGGSQSSTNWPTDTAGINSVYGLTSASPNLLPSALGVVGGSVSLLNTGQLSICRGNSTSVSFYLGNAGKGASGTYDLRIRLSTSSTSTGGTQAATFTHSLGALSEGTFALSFTVPSVSNGVYFVHLDMDHTGGIAEVREGDNRTVSGRTLNVIC